MADFTVTSSPEPKLAPSEKLLQLINKNVNRHGTAEGKKLDNIFNAQVETKEILANIKISASDLATEMGEEFEEALEEVFEKEEKRKSKTYKQILIDPLLKKMGPMMTKVNEKVASVKEAGSKAWDWATKPVFGQDEKRKENIDREANEKRSKAMEVITELVGKIWEDTKGFGKKMKDWFGEKRDKLNNYGIIGKLLGKGLDLGGFFLKTLGGPIIKGGAFLVKALPKLLMGPLGIAAASLTVLAGVGSKAYEMFQNGVYATVAKDTATFQKRWEDGNWIDMVMNPMDTLVGAFGTLGEKIGDVAYKVVNVVNEFFEGITDFFDGMWQNVKDGASLLLNKLTFGMAGKSAKEISAEKETRDQEKKWKEERKANGGIMGYEETAYRQQKMGMKIDTKEEYEANQARIRGKAVPARIKESNAVSAKSVTPETVTSAPEHIRTPENGDTPAPAATQVVKETVIIKETNNGAEIVDFIGPASSVVTNMTRT